MTKILYLSRQLDLVGGGGSNYSLDTIAEGIANLGFDVEIQVTDKIDVNKDKDYTITDITGKFEGQSYITIARKIRSHLQKISDGCDIIHVFNPSYLSVAGSIRSKVSTPIVGRLNTYTPFCTNLSRMNGSCHKNCGISQKYLHDDRSTHQKLQRAPRYIFQDIFEPKWINSLDKLFAISPSVKNIYTEYGIDEEKITVSPNMVEKKYNYSKKAIKAPKKPLSLLYVGRLEPIKGVSYLLEALQGITEQKINLDVVGDGREYDNLASYESKLANNINVNFHGFVNHDDLSKYYLNADLFVHPHTWPEPYGRVILEALQHQCPVLCSDIGAPSWIASEAGETFPPEDVSTLKDKIEKFANDPSNIVRLKKHCASQLKRFENERIITNIENEYRELL